MERLVKIPLAVLVVVATAVACGTSASESDVDSTPDAASSAPTNGTPTATATGSGTTAPPAATASADASADAASTTPLSACPSDYAQLNDFLNGTGCGQCASTKCAALTADCFNDCACIAGALAVFSCTVISTDITQCTTLVTEIPSQYQNETYVCAMTCGHFCESAAGGPLDSGSSDPITDGGADGGGGTAAAERGATGKAGSGPPLHAVAPLRVAEPDAAGAAPTRK